MKNIGIIIETEIRKEDLSESVQTRVRDICFGMITLARDVNHKLFAFVFNCDSEIVKSELEDFGITDIVDVVIEKKYQNNPDVKAKAVAGALKELDIHAVLGLSTSIGKDLLPRVAAQLDAPLVMDCIHVDIENHTAKTSHYSGKAVATIKTAGDIPIFGIRPNLIEPVMAPADAVILKYNKTASDEKKLTVIKTDDTDSDADRDLTEADIIIAGGRGMKNSENFTLLAKCAEKLNAAVGASRVAVDEGWVPYSMQVGQTGEKVSPKVYIACGISGSIQHFAGMKTSKMVIAINTDENAAIMSNCDYFIKADALQIIPELTMLLNNE